MNRRAELEQINKNKGNKGIGIHKDRMVKVLISAPPIEPGLKILKRNRAVKVVDASKN